MARWGSRGASRKTGYIHSQYPVSRAINYKDGQLTRSQSSCAWEPCGTPEEAAQSVLNPRKAITLIPFDDEQFWLQTQLIVAKLTATQAQEQPCHA